MPIFHLYTKCLRARDAWHSAGYGLPLPYSDSWINATSAQKNATLYIDSNIWKQNSRQDMTSMIISCIASMWCKRVMEVKNLTVKSARARRDIDWVYVYLISISGIIATFPGNYSIQKICGVEGTLPTKSITINPGNYIDLLWIRIYCSTCQARWLCPPLLQVDLNYWVDDNADGEISCSWSSVSDLDGDSVQYFAEIIDWWNPSNDI